MKQCSKCLEYKPTTEFTRAKHTRDGFNFWCMSCTRKNSKKQYLKNVEARKKQIAEYKKTEKGKRMSSMATHKWKEENPKKYVAHMALKQGVRYGFVKTEPCRECGAEKVHAHHFDYDRVFDVIWLCPQHHKDIHAINQLSEKGGKDE